jgi:lysozyme
MKWLFLIFLFTFQKSIFGQDSSFRHQPWQDERFPIVLDPYQENILDFDKIISDKRVVAVIHKASQGFKTDKKFSDRSKIAKAHNILYASYHLGTNTDPIKQADFYLTVINKNLSEPTALDIEDIGGNNISLEDAEKFINRIYEKTKHYPFVYVNNKVFKAINSKYDKNSVFAKCPLWYARFRSTLPVLENKVWDKVIMWQFSCELNCNETGKCLYNIPGTRFDIDVNVFNGSSQDLQTFWNSYQ